MIQIKSKKLRAAALAMALLLSFPAALSTLADGESAKEEVVYATLGNDGASADVTVVNIFSVASAREIEDYGAYESVENLTNTNPISSDGKASRVRAEKGRFYYQGTLKSAPLPWDFALIYSLDYVPVAAEDLAGRSGRVGMRLTSKKNPAVDAVFYDNYMLQVSFTLDAAKCVNIEADGATVANAGGNKQLTFTVMPGKDADCSLSADVVDFEMDGVAINAVPMSISIDRPDTDSINSDIKDLQDAITELDDGVKDLRSGVRALRDGANELADGSEKFSDGLGKLPAANKEFATYSAQFNGVLQQMQTISGTQPATEGAKMYAEIQKMQAALTALGPTAVTDPNIAQLAASTGEMGDYCRTLITLCSYISGVYDAGTRKTAPGLAANYDSYNRQLQAYLDKLDELDGNYHKLDDGVQELRDAIGKLSGGMGELSDGTGELNDETSDMDTLIEDKIDELMAEYDKSDFTPVSYVSARNTNVVSVQFVLKTEGVSVPEEEEAAPVEAPEETFWQRLGDLFGVG